jgi:Flp pilus assembly protein TadD
MLRGLALLVIGERVASAEQLEQALAEDPSLWQAANGLGLIHDIEGNWDEAEASYKQALRIKTDSATAYNNLGYSYLLQGRIEDATEMFSTSLALDPEPVITRANLRLALAAKGRYADAIAGTERKDLPQVLNDIGYVAMLLGDYDSADTFFNRAIDESPIYYDAAVANLERLNTLIDQPAEQSPVTRVGRSVGN